MREVIITRVLYGTLNQLLFFFRKGEIGEGNCAVKLVCLQMLNTSLCKIFISLFTLFKVGTILANKN